ncbi:MFS transporter [Pseudomaricurvus alkylphenolicus]|uniref:spinster family MFS transporter n=1 Tax=Pseudomaricurvus alkylphenolicus TaxID=1306991 RepID=UPI00141F406A|nr:MFS transporter [Pseudomaricurvus alkylphenolicus]NIB42447.1 MFS transporter [Pseudomaricurvus alkylphenolicus]
MLFLVYMFNFVDRQLLVILQESIKQDLGFSDTQLGMMSGFAFALLYVSFGIPIARMADRGNRRNIVALSLGIWSLMTAICGLSYSFIQMLLARMGVAVGEAGGGPPALSMISDLYSEKNRATAMSIYSSGIYAGLIAGYVFGGWLGDTYGWRTAFIVIGLPGVLLAALLMYTVEEPARYRPNGEIQDTGKKQEPFIETLRMLWNITAFRYIAIAGGLSCFSSYGIGNWMPSYLLRSFEVSTAEVGLWMGLTAGVGGLLGTFGGGVLVDKLKTSDKRWYIWLPAIAMLGTIPVGMVILTTNNENLAIALNGLTVLLFATWLAPIIALSHELVGPERRAQATAVLFFLINIIGMGMGPASVGILSDAMTSAEGVDSLSYAMMAALVFGGGFGGYCFLIAGRSLVCEVSTTRYQISLNQ